MQLCLTVEFGFLEDISLTLVQQVDVLESGSVVRLADVVMFSVPAVSSSGSGVADLALLHPYGPVKVTLVDIC